MVEIKVKLADMNFEDFYWHDAVIKNIVINRSNPGVTDEITLEIVWPHNSERIYFVFENVYWAKMNLNFGIIADENIYQGYHLPTNDSDLIQFYSQWNGLMDDITLNVYEIELSSTGGRIKIISQRFRVDKFGYRHNRSLI